MDIKCMNYKSVSGGTLTIGTEVNGRIKHNEVNIPITLSDLITVLESRVGDIDTINFQICKTQSLSEERMIINYKVNPETYQNSFYVLNISDLNKSEKLRYANLIKEVNL